MYDLNQKTIFVLDHTQYFSISSEDYIPLDFLKGKTGVVEAPMSGAGTGSSTGLQFSKSLWTCSVESSIEYCRIVWDLFPRGKLIRFIVSDTAAHIVNTWKFATQNMSHVLNAMALVGVPQRNAPQSSDYSVIHGLRAAIEALAEPTEHQISVMQTQENSGIINEKLPNKGRVICITSARDNPSMKSLEDIFHNVLMQQNTLAMSQKKLLNIDHCHLVIINMVPMNMETLVTNRSIMELSPCLTTEIHTTSAPEISNKLTHLIMSHYDLASTTVTGIPMKEEQNANSSANYDVEILHAKNAHTAICGNEALLPTSMKEGAEYETVTLKWCTPRGCGASDMSACPPCLAQHRVTPVDVTSRPSSCLINFLLNGRSVLLEMPRKTGGKTTSHLLSARGGEIFIHALQITRSCLEDPPSISEGPGGRITDYRITDFAAFIKAHRFLPLKSKTKPEENLYKARERLYSRSPYFPLTLSSTMVFNLLRNVHWLPNFIRKISKEDMDKADEIQCQQNIYELYTASTRRELLPFPNLSANRVKGHKKIDQYKLLCAELEVLVKGYAKTPYHKVILESIQNVRAACGDATVKSETDFARDAAGKSIIRATTDSPLSPPHSIDTCSSSSTQMLKSNKRSFSNVGQRSLFDIVASAERSQSNKRADFTGRLCTPLGQVAKLYPEFGTKDKDGTNGTPVKDENLNFKNNFFNKNIPKPNSIFQSIFPENMFPNSSVRKLVQISEEALPSVHVPFIFGNLLYILTQQDSRKTEDTRMFSLSKILPNGDVKIASPQETDEWLQQLPKHANVLHNQQMLFNLLQLLNRSNNSHQECTQHALPQTQLLNSTVNGMPYPQPMETSSTSFENRTVASIEQQLQWNKSENTSLSLPMHYSHGTSTTEIAYEQQGIKNQQTSLAICSCCEMSKQCRTRKKLCNRSTNTQELLKSETLDAREQLKKIKMRNFCT